MLPFLRNQKEGSASESVEPTKRNPDLDDNSDDSLLGASIEQLLSPASSMAERIDALKAAFQILENQPHSEVSHNG